MMELRVDVTPSPSNGYEMPANSPYEQVDFREVEIPHFHQIKRLGRGSYGTVIQGRFRNKLVAVSLHDDHYTPVLDKTPR